MFGYKLIRIKSEDKKLLEQLKNSVKYIQYYSSSVSTLTNEADFTDRHTILLISAVEALSSFIDIYINNKFSSPSAGINLYKEIDSLHKYVAAYLEMANKIMQLSSSVDNGEITEEYAQASLDNIKNEVLSIAASIISSTLFIRISVKHDAIRIQENIDIIKEYYDNQKMFKKYGNYNKLFTVTFKALSKTERNDLFKNNIK